MGVYECSQNAQNKIKISKENLGKVIVDNGKVLEKINEIIMTNTVVGFDGWYGILWDDILKTNNNVELINVLEIFKDRKSIAEYNFEFITDDPGFGKVNKLGMIEDLIDDEKVKTVKEKVKRLVGEGKKVVLYGSGSYNRKMIDIFDASVYFYKTHQAIQWMMWNGELIPFGSSEPISDYHWKEYNYSDFYLLQRQKNFMLENMDYYVDALDAGDMKLLPKDAYDEMMQTLVKYPIKQVKIFSPGPWGAYRYRDFFNVPGLECNAWNKIAGPELRVLVDLGLGNDISVTMTNIMQYGEEFVGPHLFDKYPGWFPLDIWLDDGYFPEPQPAERTSMPIHIHPSSSYVRRHFGEPVGRYETYYIVEAYENANTWLGYNDDISLEEWEDKCRQSNNITPIEDWKKYIKRWDSKEGDLYLIPPGTVHGHGGNQMVLEMDTNDSVNGTEYSFFEYDFARPSWDDDKKAMTGKPMKMHLEHAFDMEKSRRASWVGENLISKAEVIKWTKDYYMERFSSYVSMPYHVERLTFDKFAENTTDKKFMQILTLSVGTKVKISSKANPDIYTIIEKYQSAIVPAYFGDYKIESEDSGRSVVMVQRWKEA